MRTADHLQAIDDRLGRLDAKIDERFAGVDARFTGIDKRLEEDRAHFDALYEASRADFNNLYDFVKAQAEKTDVRFEQMQTEFRTRFIDLQTAITALTRGRRTSGRRRR